MIRLIAFAVVLVGLPAIAGPATAAADEIVRYQLKEWKAKHILDAKKAAPITVTLTKLGCERK